MNRKEKQIKNDKKVEQKNNIKSMFQQNVGSVLNKITTFIKSWVIKTKNLPHALESTFDGTVKKVSKKRVLIIQIAAITAVLILGTSLLIFNSDDNSSHKSYFALQAENETLKIKITEANSQKESNPIKLATLRKMNLDLQTENETLKIKITEADRKKGSNTVKLTTAIGTFGDCAYYSAGVAVGCR